MLSDEVTSCLQDVGLIEVTSSNTIKITTAGQLAVDYSVRHPEQMGTYLRSGGININVQGDLNVDGDVVGRDKTSAND